MKLLIIFGTRPEFIKLYPLITFLKKKNIKVISVNSGQHDKLLSNIMNELRFKADITLKTSSKKISLNEKLSLLLRSFNNNLNFINPDFILVQGDTLTAFAASVYSFNNKIKLCHLEAGLRTYDINSPFPEEMYRRLISQIATLHFCPTKISFENLIKENIKSNLFITGNTIVDTIYLLKSKINISTQNLKNFLLENHQFDIEKNPYILFTCHRRENYGENFEQICKAIIKISEKFNDIKVIYPLHLNPNFYQKAKKNFLKNKNIILIENQTYLNMLSLIKNSLFIITDSGGIQEEAPSFDKFVFVIRNHTERQESIKIGISKLIGNKYSLIIKNIDKYKKLIHQDLVFRNPYGDGQACKKIFNILKQYK